MQNNEDNTDLFVATKEATLPGEIRLPLPPPFRIARLADMYYISISPMQLDNTSAAVKQLSVFFEGKLEDETVILTIDPACYVARNWSNYMTFMGVIQNAKCKVVVKCDKMDFTPFAYFYLLGDQLEFYPEGALFFQPLYTSNKKSLCDHELAGVSYVEKLLKSAVERGIITEDQFDIIDRGGFSSIDYDTMLERKREGLGDSIILRE